MLRRRQTNHRSLPGGRRHGRRGWALARTVRDIDSALLPSQKTGRPKAWHHSSPISTTSITCSPAKSLDRIEPLLAKVCSVYGEQTPELLQIQALFGELKRELILHMMKEENILFPYITQLEEAMSAGMSAPVPMFGTVRNPVRMMMTEHDGAGDVLRSIRQLSNDFNLPADACVSYQTFYGALEELEQDLHQHIHLENNILFPCAIEMEG